MYLRAPRNDGTRLGSGYLDWLRNLNTGLLTQNDLERQIRDCAENNVRASGGSTTVDDQAQQCRQSLTALVKLQGGVADDATHTLLPTLPDWSAIIKLGALGLIGFGALFVMSRR